MKNRYKTLLILLLLAIWASGASHAAATSPVVPRYGKFEASFSLPGQSGNPFDPRQNDVDAILYTPGIERIKVPAFWDGSLWRVRFAPARVGAYTMTITRNGRLAKTSGLTAHAFRCIPSSNPGFVRRDPRAVQLFLFDSGQVYYPLGINVAWRNGGEPEYRVTLGKFRDAGMNWVRIWMNHWDDKNLEWRADKPKNPPIGSYSMDVARKWDIIVDSAGADGVYIQMTLQHHGQYTNEVNPNWADNPFNAANGGFLHKPDDFFTDPRAVALTKAKYRYIVARYGYSTHILSWELFNEVQNIRETSSHFQDVVDWHNRMAVYIRSIDPYHHLITTSYTPVGDPLTKTSIDYLQLHDYIPDIVTGVLAQPIATSDRPVFIGEWGTSGAPVTPALLHRAIWSSLMFPAAGAAMFWSWDQMDSLHGWQEYRSASSFLRAYSVASLGDIKRADAQVDAPGERGDLSFSPPLRWAPSTSLDARVNRDGSVAGIDGMSSFLQGKGHTDMQPRPFAFHLNAPAPCRFAVRFGDVSKAGAHPTLGVDENAGIRESDFPASSENHPSNATLAVDVPAGEHTVILGNTGPDWITVDKMTVTGYSPPLALIARGNERSASFWTYARDAQTPVTGGHVVFGGMAPGRYQLRLWDTHQGRPIGGGSASFSRGRVTVVLPTIDGDLAGVVVRQSPR